MAGDWLPLDVLSPWEEPVLGCKGLAHRAGELDLMINSKFEVSTISY